MKKHPTPNDPMAKICQHYIQSLFSIYELNQKRLGTTNKRIDQPKFFHNKDTMPVVSKNWKWWQILVSFLSTTKGLQDGCWKWTLWSFWVPGVSTTFRPDSNLKPGLQGFCQGVEIVSFCHSLAIVPLVVNP